MSGKEEEAAKLAEWRRLMLDHVGHECGSCQRKSHIWPSLLVPIECGGRYLVTNGYVLCRDCRVVIDQHKGNPAKIHDKVPINFLISRTLHEQAEEFVRRPGGVGTLSLLIRNMISMFVDEPNEFEDIQLFQSEGAHVKVNIWCDAQSYDRFRLACMDRGLSFTEVFKALILMAITKNYTNLSGET